MRELNESQFWQWGFQSCTLHRKTVYIGDDLPQDILNIFVPKKVQCSGHITTIFHVCVLPSLESLVDLFTNVSYLRKKWMGILGTWLVVCPLKLATSGLFQQNCTLSNLPKIIRSTEVRTPHQNKSKGEVSRVNRGSAPASTANTSGLSTNIDSETKYLF